MSTGVSNVSKEGERARVFVCQQFLGSAATLTSQSTEKGEVVTQISFPEMTDYKIQPHRLHLQYVGDSSDGLFKAYSLALDGGKPFTHCFTKNEPAEVKRTLSSRNFAESVRLAAEEQVKKRPSLLAAPKDL